MTSERETPEKIFQRSVAWFEKESKETCDKYLKESQDRDRQVDGSTLASQRSAYAQRVSALVKAAKRDFLIGYYQWVKKEHQLDLTPTVVGHALQRVMGRKIHFAVLVNAFGQKGRSAKTKSSVGEAELAEYDKAAGQWLKKLTRAIDEIKDENRARTEAAVKKSKRIRK